MTDKQLCQICYLHNSLYINPKIDINTMTGKEADRYIYLLSWKQNYRKLKDRHPNLHINALDCF